jgi:hypothetical protein
MKYDVIPLDTTTLCPCVAYSFFSSPEVDAMTIGETVAISSGQVYSLKPRYIVPTGQLCFLRRSHNSYSYIYLSSSYIVSLI